MRGGGEGPPQGPPHPPSFAIYSIGARIPLISPLPPSLSLSQNLCQFALSLSARFSLTIVISPSASEQKYLRNTAVETHKVMGHFADEKRKREWKARREMGRDHRTAARQRALDKYPALVLARRREGSLVRHPVAAPAAVGRLALPAGPAARRLRPVLDVRLRLREVREEGLRRVLVRLRPPDHHHLPCLGPVRGGEHGVVGADAVN
mmetsp:Transcript_18153/g.70166  ORF Transcript_18153/g.70166 Transcript_18153/m.70166 type:complete len:207 (-) Transcript_18153:1045-1665(-)